MDLHEENSIPNPKKITKMMKPIPKKNFPKQVERKPHILVGSFLLTSVSKASEEWLEWVSGALYVGFADTA